ncbi:NFYB/HAP3 family transcription factor subunit [Candidatus Woesearchaeota archaeon]|nr:NFYB/HAP3 family transcription factor subunit [Candidatus Woesearchaeota archaeon]
MAKNVLPLAAMENLLKTKSSAVRVSNDAKEALRELLENYGSQVGDRAVKAANHAGRKTIKAVDIKLASQN